MVEEVGNVGYEDNHNRIGDNLLLDRFGRCLARYF
jgi:hypothetical protein